MGEAPKAMGGAGSVEDVIETRERKRRRLNVLSRSLDDLMSATLPCRRFSVDT
jgi:hypothetical protein